MDLSIAESLVQNNRRYQQPRREPVLTFADSFALLSIPFLDPASVTFLTFSFGRLERVFAAVVGALTGLVGVFTLSEKSRKDRSRA